MGLTVSASSGGGNFIQVPAGMHLAMCYRIIDLGTQKTTYMGQSKMSPKVLFQFEVHTENDDGTPLLTQDGKPLSISKQYTLSLGENAIMRRDLQSWRGKAFTPEELKMFELENVLGQWCMINVVHTSKDDKTYANIDSITPVPAAIKKNGLPDAANPPVIFSIRSADMTVFETFSDYIKDKIKSSPEWETWGSLATPSEAPAEKGADFDDFESDIPF
jgi:hypothetical protein